VGQTTNGVGVDQQSVASDSRRAAPEPARRRLYVSVTMKFVVAQTFAAAWLGVSVWLSLPWLRELAVAITTVPAILVVSLIAYLPGWLVAFLALSLLLDRQPPLRGAYPAIPVTVLIAARNEAERIQETSARVAGQDYPGPIEVLVVDNGSTDGTRPSPRRSVPRPASRSAASASRSPARATPSTPAWPQSAPSWSSPWTPIPCCTRRLFASWWHGC
jgi:hypothetical protein